MKLQDFMAIHSHITNVCKLLKHTDMDGTWRVSRNMFWGRWELPWSVILDAGTLVHSSVSRAVKTNTECCLIVSSNTMLQWPREWDVKLSSRKYLDILCFVTHKYIDSVFRYLDTFYVTLQIIIMEFLVKSVTVARSKLKFLRSRQAVFIYATMFYLVFMLLHKPKFIPGAEFSSNKEGALVFISP